MNPANSVNCGPERDDGARGRRAHDELGEQPRVAEVDADVDVVERHVHRVPVGGLADQHPRRADRQFVVLVGDRTLAQQGGTLAAEQARKAARRGGIRQCRQQHGGRRRRAGVMRTRVRVWSARADHHTSGPPGAVYAAVNVLRPLIEDQALTLEADLRRAVEVVEAAGAPGVDSGAGQTGRRSASSTPPGTGPSPRPRCRAAAPTCASSRVGAQHDPRPRLAGAGYGPTTCS